VPVKTQIANHLARFTAFKDSDLVFVFAGANDVFTQFGIFGATAAQVQADAAAGKLTADQANNLLLQAQLTAQAGMKQAAIELGGYVKNEILAKGGKYVVVMTLPDIVNTPFGQSAQVPASARPTLTALSQTFNLWIREEMTGQPVQLIDNFALFAGFYNNPATYGLTNVTVPACDATKIAAITGGKVTDGSSLFCNSTPGLPWNGLRTGADVNTWLFSDAVHPTTGGHKVFSGELVKQLKAFGWI
jgi:phospholipase/lecithinase/hemolysin